MGANGRWVCGLLGIACGSTPSKPESGDTAATDSATDIGAPTDSATVGGTGEGALTITALGQTFALELSEPIELTDAPLGLLSVVGARVGPTASAAIGVYDDQALQTGTYDLGLWGGPAEQTQIVFLFVEGASVHEFHTELTEQSAGSIAIDTLDRDLARIAFSFTGDLRHTLDGADLGLEAVTGVLAESTFLPK